MIQECSSESLGHSYTIGGRCDSLQSLRIMKIKNREYERTLLSVMFICEVVVVGGEDVDCFGGCASDLVILPLSSCRKHSFLS